jgi:CBS domain-containing protein
VLALLADNVATLKLVTLRRLALRAPAPIVLDEGTPVHEVVERGAPIAIFVDNAGVLTGTLSLVEACCVDPATSASDVMKRDVPVLLAEDDVDAARRVMSRCGRVIVVTASGALLGVLTAGDLA